MVSNKSTTGRGKRSTNTKKSVKEPIPINSGTASQTSSTSNDSENIAQMQGFPGIEEEIRVRAYQLYEQRGREHGRDGEDWTRAEVEVLAKYTNKERSA